MISRAEDHGSPRLTEGDIGAESDLSQIDFLLSATLSLEVTTDSLIDVIGAYEGDNDVDKMYRYSTECCPREAP